MYNPRVVDASSLIPRLSFEISGAERRMVRSKTRQGFAQLFVRAIHRYLDGLGHPEHEIISDFQTLTQEDIGRELGSPHTRPHLLLAAFTESKVLPREDTNWNLKVSDTSVPFPSKPHHVAQSSSWRTQSRRRQRQVHPNGLTCWAPS